MRIAFLTHYSELYGANLSLLNLIDGLRRYGHSAAVICPDRGDLLAALARHDVPTVIIPFAWWASSHPTASGAAKRFLVNMHRLPRLTQQLKDWQAELVYSN